MLLTCPECQNQVSDQAETCPKCGYPVKKMMERMRIFVFDHETMTGKTPADDAAIEVAEDFYGELLASGDGRVWNSGGQVVAEFRYK